MPKTKNPHTDLIYMRIDAVVNLVLENDRYTQKKRETELRDIVANKFGVSKRTALRYIKEALREINKLGKPNHKKAFEKAIRDREFLFQKAKGSKDGNGNYIIKPDYKLALEIVKDRDKLFGLYVDEVKHSGTISINNIDLSKLTDEQLSILESIIKKGEDPKPYLLSVGINVKSN
ncbi:MAG: hypothetical protein CMF23_17890 [Ignavibacteriae bacterium]|nr:hypothetical protein [Ignavibacteriota bacterium]|tara:strand:+ start:93 stop:620 length:528 start_codon:yes stop_codon:yes gene_type:complete